MREEIYYGLKNAIEHGSSLEDAINSFIAAGYNPAEVKEAAESLTTGAFTITGSKESNSSSRNLKEDLKNQLLPKQNNLAPSYNQVLRQQDTFQESYQRKKGKKTAIIVVLVIIMLLLIFAIIGLIFFEDKIMSLFK